MTGRFLVVAMAVAGCHQPTFATVPGQTDIIVTKVTIEPRGTEHLEVHYKELLENFGNRAKKSSKCCTGSLRLCEAWERTSKKKSRQRT